MPALNNKDKKSLPKTLFWKTDEFKKEQKEWFKRLIKAIRERDKK